MSPCHYRDLIILASQACCHPPYQSAGRAIGQCFRSAPRATAVGQQARAAYLVKHPFCAYCLRDAGISYQQDAVTIGLACATKGIGQPHAQVVDHIEPHRGDQALFWNKANWQALCSTHHSADKQREEAAQRRGE